MTLEQIDQLKMDYIDGTISAENLKLLIQIMEEKNESIQSLDELDKMLNQLDSQNVPSTSHELDNRIEHLLSKKQESVNWFLKQRYLMIAVYTVIILGAGTGIGILIQSINSSDLSVEMSELRELVLSTMNGQESTAGNRIKAISLSSQLNNLDEAIVDILLHTFNTDPNVNVRLATLRVLSGYFKNEQVRIGLVTSITLQKSPLIQIALLNVMIEWREKSSIKQFMRLLNSQDLDGLVINQIESGLEQI